MDRMWAPWRMAYIGGERPEGAPCFLCEAAEVGDPLLLDTTELTVTLLNRFPYSSGHLMVVPRRHIPDITALTPEEGAAMMRGAQQAVGAITAAMSPHGFNMGINQGFAAGGSVADHLHLHVVPRWAGDTNFMPVLADVKAMPELLETTADRLRAAFEDLRGE